MAMASRLRRVSKDKEKAATSGGGGGSSSSSSSSSSSGRERTAGGAPRSVLKHPPTNAGGYRPSADTYEPEDNLPSPEAETDVELLQPSPQQGDQPADEYNDGRSPPPPSPSAPLDALLQLPADETSDGGRRSEGRLQGEEEEEEGGGYRGPTADLRSNPEEGAAADAEEADQEAEEEGEVVRAEGDEFEYEAGGPAGSGGGGGGRLVQEV